MNLDYKTLRNNYYHLMITALTAGAVTLALLLPEPRLIALFIILDLIASYLYLLKREWDSIKNLIAGYFKDYEAKVTYSVLGGTTLLKEPATPFTNKLLRQCLGCSIKHKGIGVRINFLQLTPRLNPLMQSSNYDYELLILGYSSESLTNELYQLGFKEKVIPEGIELLINTDYSSFYIKDDNYLSNPLMLVANVFKAIDRSLSVTK